MIGKAALVAAACAAGAWLYLRSRDASGPSLFDRIAHAAGAFSPANPDNVFASTVNDGVSAVVGYPETLGGAVYDSGIGRTWTDYTPLAIPNRIGDAVGDAVRELFTRDPAKPALDDLTDYRYL